MTHPLDRFVRLGDAILGRLRRARRRAARAIDPTVDAVVASREREAARVREERDAALRRMDDLAVRILNATLAVGRIGRVEIDRSEGHEPYMASQVDELLEVAREALLETEDVARYATLTRRQAAQTLGHDPALELNTARGTLDRLRHVLGRIPIYDGDSLAFEGADEVERAWHLANTALGEISP